MNSHQLHDFLKSRIKVLLSNNKQGADKETVQNSETGRTSQGLSVYKRCPTEDIFKACISQTESPKGPKNDVSTRLQHFKTA